ncbi:MAG: hypothetical protein WBE68_03285 [Candidatus Nitrosopolaris sp.]
MSKYPQYCTNPDINIKWAVQSSGEDKFLDEKLEQLRSIDSIDFYKRLLQPPYLLLTDLIFLNAGLRENYA